MSVWDNFYAVHGEPDALRPKIPLTEENIANYVTTDSSYLLDCARLSHMLELAHERRFALAQLDSHHFRFDIQHPARVSDALQRLSIFFDGHTTHESQAPSSPFTKDLFDFRIYDSPNLEAVPHDIAIEDDLPSVSVSPDPTSPASRTLSISELINPPEQMPIYASIIRDHVTIEPDDAMDSGVDGGVLEMFRSQVPRASTRQPPIPFAMLRAHKQTRVRLKSPSNSKLRSERVQLGLDHSPAQYQYSTEPDVSANIQPTYEYITTTR